MRIAVSGTHRVGKTTLAGALADALPGHELIEEPYHEMVAEGHVFSHPPTPADFEDQLEHSLMESSEPRNDVIFDRCPADLLAYLIASAADGHSELERWAHRIRPALRSLDLVVLVPIESPDRIDVREEDSPFAREAVEEELRTLLVHDPLGIGVEVLEVGGSPRARVAAVLRRLG